MKINKPNKIAAIACSAFLALATTSIAQPLTNASFELGSLGGTPDDWVLALSGGTATNTDLYAKAGTRSLLIDSTGAGGWSSPNAHQQFPASPGDEFKFNGWMLRSASIPGGSFGLLKMEFRNSVGTPLVPASASIGQINLPFPGVESLPFLNDANVPANTWLFTQLQGVAPAGTVNVRFYVLNVNAPGAMYPMYFDDLKAEKILSPAGVTITAPTNGAIVFTNFFITATASAPPGNITNVTFYRGTTILGSDDTAPFSLNNVSAAPGLAQLKAVAQADTGPSIFVTSSVVNVTITDTVTVSEFGVNPAASWTAYMNWFQTPQNGGAFVQGSTWGIADLSAQFSGSGLSSVLTLKPAPLNDTNAYWYDYESEPLFSNPGNLTNAVGFKEMEANFYVQLPDGSVNGNLVKFTGVCKTNTLDIRLNPASTNGIGNGWTNYAFVKELAADYSTNLTTYVALTSGLPFSVSLQTSADPTLHVQYGFVTRGPNVWPSDVDKYGNVQIQSTAAVSTNFIVDSTAGWVGYMNVFTNQQGGGGYSFGSAWGTADLKAVFNTSGLVLSPNTINDPSPEWYTPSGQPGAVGNRTMDANFYQEFTGPLAGKNVTFTGTVLSNTLVSALNTNVIGNGWTAFAFIKDLAPDYSSFNWATVPLTPGAFNVSLFTANDPARHVQFGFVVTGPNVWVTDAAPFGNIVIGNAGVLPTTITPSLNGANLNLTFASQLGKTYTVQFKNSLTNATWNTFTITNGTGANAVVVDPASGNERYYRLSIQ
jgi:hypothetical protein